MKIDDAVKKASAPGVGTTQARAGKGTDRAAASKPSTDNVHLSSQVKALASQGESSSVFDSKKVQEIKAAIASGQFQVDPEKVANGLLDTVNDLIHARKA